jgi:hypothetical protein
MAQSSILGLQPCSDFSGGIARLESHEGGITTARQVNQSCNRGRRPSDRRTTPRNGLAESVCGVNQVSRVAVLHASGFLSPETKQDVRWDGE